MNEIVILPISISFFLTILLIIEKNRLNKIITPFSVATFPFLIIILINNLILIHLDFPAITSRAQFFILSQLIVLWIIGYIISNFFNREKLSEYNVYGFIKEQFKRYDIILIIISWISIFVISRRIMNLFSENGGLMYFGNPEYEEKLSQGLAAHFVHIGQVCFLFLIFIFKNSNHKKLILLTLFGLFVIISAIQVKYHILWLVLMTFYFIISDKPPKRQILILGFAALTMLLVFNLFWIAISLTVPDFFKTSEDIFLYLVKQTANYLFTGPILLDHWMGHSNVKPDWTLIIVLKNLVNVINGNPLRYEHVPLLNLGFEKITGNIYSNVGTAYGVYYLIGGFIFTFAMTILTSIIYYFTFFYSYMSQRFDILFFNLFFLTLATLTFFVQFFTSLATYELIVIFLLFGTTFKFINLIIDKISIEVKST